MCGGGFGGDATPVVWSLGMDPKRSIAVVTGAAGDIGGMSRLWSRSQQLLGTDGAG
jgi:hypothetical protein